MRLNEKLKKNISSLSFVRVNPYSLEYDTEDELEGKNVFYFPNGVTAAVGYYKNGYKTGPWIYRDKTGKVKEKELYKAGGKLATAKETEEFFNKNKTADEKENSDNNTGNTTTPDNGGTPDKESFWDKNKNWIKPVAIGAGGITLLAIGYQLLRSTKAKNKSSPAGAALSGVPKQKRKNHHRQQKRKTTKKAVALL